MGKPAQQSDPVSAKAAFQRALIGWFRKHGRHELPWRKTGDPYAILVSEIMLQQTQVATVLDRGFYTRWLKRFPDAETLAEADEADVLKAWEGLGYYNRARNLQKAAGVIVREFGGRFPESANEIRKLPGVGPYTAGAVASICFGEAVPVVDGNVIRVFTRLFDYREPADSTAAKNQFWKWAGQLVPGKRAADFNAGLMELGQRICSKGTPDCGACPVAKFCAARDPESLPVKKGGPETVFLTERVIFAEAGGKILLEKETGSRRKGLWKLPVVSGFDSDGCDLPEILKTKYSITHHRVDLIVQGWVGDPTGLNRKGESGDNNLRWFDVVTDLPEIAMPSPYRRAIETILRNRREAANFELQSE